MKAPRYKFDEAWTRAIRLMPYISEEYTERMIRDYIEGKRTEEYVNHEFLETYFECAWVLIKDCIDSRKERNERARLKRVARREALLAQAARLKAVEDERVAREEAARKAQAEAAEALRKERARKRRERHVDRTNCISPRRKPAPSRNLSSPASGTPATSVTPTPSVTPTTSTMAATPSLSAASQASVAASSVLPSTFAPPSPFDNLLVGMPDPAPCLPPPARFSDRFRGPACHPPISRRDSPAI